MLAVGSSFSASSKASLFNSASGSCASKALFSCSACANKGFPPCNA